MLTNSSYTNFGLDVSAGTRALMMCGQCTTPAAYHGVAAYVDLTCEYDFATNGPRDGYDYFLHDASGNVTVYTDLAGQIDSQYEQFQYGVEYKYPNDETDSSDDIVYCRIEDSPEYYNSIWDNEYAALDRWYDKQPNECTSVLGDFYPVPNGMTINTTPYSDSVRNVYLEGADGFTSRELLDLTVTRNYQARLLNCFTHKRTGKFHVGSIEFTFGDNTFTATCINPECNRKCDDGSYRRASWTVSRSIMERATQEAVVYTIIRHGNNHGPKWLTTRKITTYNARYNESSWFLSESDKVLYMAGLKPNNSPTSFGYKENEATHADWYVMHDFSCDLNHDGIVCNHNRVTTDAPTNLNDVEFVMEHQRYCKDSGCACSKWLANEVPALKEVA